MWSPGADALTVTPTSAKPASDAAIVFKIRSSPKCRRRLHPAGAWSG
ncbi:MAG: hypothetical protein JF599_00315 [Verrucomicrobia bacterium]|nr:hypothetical protein [Verrucomicrobiota bacterium]